MHACKYKFRYIVQERPAFQNAEGLWDPKQVRFALACMSDRHHPYLQVRSQPHTLVHGRL